MFNDGVTDRLPERSRLVRVFGPICSGKTVCAGRLVVQEIDAGRHVTVIRSGGTPFETNEYKVDGIITSADLSVVDAESLSTASQCTPRAGGETIVVDADAALGPDRVRDLVVQLADTMSGPHNDTRMVVFVSGPDDLSELPGLFDTEIVLPGKHGHHRPEAIQNALQRLSGDAVTVARVAARVRGGGVVTPHESQILDILDRLSGDSREYVSQQMTRIIEDPMPSTAGFQHGILRAPDAALTEFTLPVLPADSRTGSPHRSPLRA